jgi:hypothetical protein
MRGLVVFREVGVGEEVFLVRVLGALVEVEVKGAVGHHQLYLYLVTVQ